ncbi:cellulose binding domain-containing protein [Actinocrinis puniceicyclus]|uniref:Cellulose binding domain-containing protein n=1 Tax=Actinocrinis puniceicyclus TaxID=977794 RepID=A0A8J7WSC8_9ACTN|nr:cellulose binding domain-containing protein [Actinocrinis puniceicyclus]MBS2964755.1 cellulose binding domain-containing protein [Actinocrinis puniceicyclus]
MRRLSFPRRGRLVALAMAMPLVAVGAVAVTVVPASAATSASVSVNAGQLLAKIPATGVGTNVAVYDGAMNSSASAGLLNTGGFRVVRYPGGSYSDGYHWQTNTMQGGGYVAPNTDFDSFMGTVKSAGAQAIITANYGSGTPQEAAAWVQYANVTKGYGVKYWEIGNEVYGNGEYGASWEIDTHTSHSATTYANNLLQYVSAMKAVDPTIKIGAVLTTPGSWPDAIVGSGDSMDWNHTVLSIAGPKIDFVIVHHYPNSTGEANLLGKPQAEIPGMANTLHSLINQYTGSNAPNVGIAVTEANANAYKDTAPNGLFAPDEYLTWMEHGAFNLDWWDMRNGTDCSAVTTVDGATDYNDGGMISSGASCEPPAQTPFPPYYGTEMITKLGSAGDSLVQTSSSTSLISAHAVKRADGDVDVMLINKDPNNAATVSLSYSGFTPSSATPTVYSYLKNATAIGSAAAGSAGSQTVPAYSIVVVQLHPGGGGSPSPSASSSSSPSSSPSASPSSSPSASASPTGGTGSGTCKVSYVKNEWQGGMTANLTVTNTGGASVNGWTLGFTFPGDTRVTNAWNANVTQNGSAVTAANLSYDATIPPGGNVSFGFQGTWTGNDANPSAFTLNGASCALG